MDRPPRPAGEGISAELIRRLLEDRRERYATLASDPRSAARGMYQRAGWRQVDEAVRILWLSQLYPLGKIKFELSTGLRANRTVQLVRIRGDVAWELRARYGPRPYGPLGS